MAKRIMIEGKDYTDRQTTPVISKSGSRMSRTPKCSLTRFKTVKGSPGYSHLLATFAGHRAQIFLSVWSRTQSRRCQLRATPFGGRNKLMKSPKQGPESTKKGHYRKAGEFRRSASFRE